MSGQVLARFKPGASVATHLLVAAMLWSGIGIYLIIRGLLLFGAGTPWLLAAALALGAVKAHWLLARAARRNIERILAMADGACLGGVYSWRMWGLVIVMMLVGRGLRMAGLAGQWVGLAYLAVGLALFLASRLFWQAWRPGKNG